MRQLLASALLALVIVTVFAVPLTAFVLPQMAEAALVPCGDGERDEDGAVKAEDMCEIGDLFLLVEKIINWLLAVMIPLATLSIGVAGGMLIISGGNEERRSQAKEIIKLAVTGLVLALAAWIIVRTLVDFIKNPEADIIDPLEQVNQP